MTKKNELAVRNLDDEQVALIKNTVAKGATDDELKLFIAVANRCGLDPFTRQIHFVKRNVWNNVKRTYEEVGTIQTGIDGYRAAAARTGEHAGTDDAVIEEMAGLPVKAQVTVYRMIQGTRAPFAATARFSEYAQSMKDGKLIRQWEKMPFLMLSKCAEALALRKAFPADLSGVYVEEEVQVMEDGKPTKSKTKPVEAAVVEADPDKEVKNRIGALMRVLGKKPAEDTPEAWSKAVEEATGIALAPGNYEEIVDRLNVLQQEGGAQA
uniref:Putative DNA recombination protein n=1 Tax=viral metagenome TaxID=1070528 RepID=A0A6H2A0R5_9ZZZZ